MSERVRIAVDGRPLDVEVRAIAGPASAPRLVFLHEGLGSVAMWKDFPDRLCAAGGFRGLVYSRPGYGRSTPRREPYGVDFMHREAERVLPALLDALAIDVDADPPWLFGHSDGASIALIHAATFPDRVAGTVVMAPHILVEPISVESIAKAKVTYETTDFPSKLARYHDDVESAFRGWNTVWLEPAFRDWTIEALLPAITGPLLAIQGEADEYGTMAQVDGIARAVPHARQLKLADCGHSPHRDQTDAVIRATVDFVATHHENHTQELTQEET